MMITSVPKGLYYFQLIYSIWQFVRVAKFFAIPYGVLSSLWNKGLRETWFQDRELLLATFIPTSNRYGDVKFEDRQFDDVNRCFNVGNLGTKSRACIECHLDGKAYHLWCDHSMYTSLLQLLNFKLRSAVVCEEKNLWKGVFYYKEMNVESSFEHIIKGGRFEYRKNISFLDQSSTELLNQNFLRIVSIAPIALQARGYDFYSVLLTVLILFLDIFNYAANCVWDVFKTKFIRFVKWLLSTLLPVGMRLAVVGVLASGTRLFLFCDTVLNKSYYEKFEYLCILESPCRLPENFEVVEATPQPLGVSVSGEFSVVRVFNIRARRVLIRSTLTYANGENAALGYSLKTRLFVAAEPQKIKLDMRSVTDLQKLFWYLGFMEREGIMPCVVQKKRMHMLEISDMFNSGFFRATIGKLDKRVTFYVSDFGICTQQQKDTNRSKVGCSNSNTT